jgi:hypothetical protein
MLIHTTHVDAERLANLLPRLRVKRNYVLIYDLYKALNEGMGLIPLEKFKQALQHLLAAGLITVARLQPPKEAKALQRYNLSKTRNAEGAIAWFNALDVRPDPARMAQMHAKQMNGQPLVSPPR